MILHASACDYTTNLHRLISQKTKLTEVKLIKIQKHTYDIYIERERETDRQTDRDRERQRSIIGFSWEIQFNNHFLHG